MAKTIGLEKTLHQGEFTLLHRARLQACRVTVTGISGEFTTIPFKVLGGLRIPLLSPSEVPKGVPFDAAEVRLSATDAFPSARILASTPDGVGSLDIVYDIRTGPDA